MRRLAEGSRPMLVDCPTLSAMPGMPGSMSTGFGRSLCRGMRTINADIIGSDLLAFINSERHL